MATDGPDPAPCDKEVYERGTTVFVTHSISSNRMERWVKAVSELSGQRVDWFFMGGRAVVRAIGDIELATVAIRELMPMHDALYRESTEDLRKIIGDDACRPSGSFYLDGEFVGRPEPTQPRSSSDG